MPRKKKVNADQLLEAIKTGKGAKNIMDDFGLKSLAQLKALYVDALTSTGQITPIISSRGGIKAEGASRDLKINKRGSLVVPKEIIDEMGFGIGDTFTVRKTAAGVSLKKS